MPHPFFIRPASLDDQEALLTLFVHSYSNLLTQDYDRGVLEGALPLITQPQPALLTCGTFFVAECVQTDRIIGAGGWSDLGPVRGVSGADLGHMRHVATRPDWLRRGVARALLEVSLASAEAHGMRQMTCMSTYSARSFYTAMGFESAAEVELRLAPGVYFPAVHMSLTFDQPAHV